MHACRYVFHELRAPLNLIMLAATDTIASLHDALAAPGVAGGGSAEDTATLTVSDVGRAQHAQRWGPGTWLPHNAWRRRPRCTRWRRA